MTATGQVTSVVALSALPGGVFYRGQGGGETGVPLTLDMLLAAEVLLHEHDPGRAEADFLALRASAVPAELATVMTDLRDRVPARSFSALRGALLAFDDERKVRVADLTEQSRATRQVLRCTGMQQGLTHTARPPDFGELLGQLEQHGLLVPAPGLLDWGQLRRLHPVCPAFGATRGTPIDRYYLTEFIAEIREQVQGDVVEIGGRDDNREAYGFTGVKTYRGLDIAAAAGVSLVGDAADPDVLPEAEFDAVIAFNVLEHTPRPWEVVDNMRRWLRPGGTAFCMVPSAQRLHGAPEDYWRPLPAALLEMFSRWSERRPRQYGNPLTAVASLLGISAEELSPAELATSHPDYPVATCIVARK